MVMYVFLEKSEILKITDNKNINEINVIVDEEKKEAFYLDDITKFEYKTMLDYNKIITMIN